MGISRKNKFIILRNEHNLTQEQVAEMLNISKSTYCRIEKGQQDISVEALKKLLKIYNITFEDFYNIKLPIADFPRVSGKHIHDNFQQGGFAGSVAADDCHSLASFNLYIYMLKQA